MKPQQNLSFGGEGLSEVNNILKVDLKNENQNNDSDLPDIKSLSSLLPEVDKLLTSNPDRHDIVVNSIVAIKLAIAANEPQLALQLLKQSTSLGGDKKALNELFEYSIQHRSTEVIYELISMGATNIPSALLIMQKDESKTSWKGQYEATYQALVDRLVAGCNAIIRSENGMNTVLFCDLNDSETEKKSLTEALSFMINKKQTEAKTLLAVKTVKILLDLDKLLLDAIKVGNCEACELLIMGSNTPLNTHLAVSNKCIAANYASALVLMQSFSTAFGWSKSGGYHQIYALLVSSLATKSIPSPLTIVYSNVEEEQQNNLIRKDQIEKESQIKNQEKTKLLEALQYMIKRNEPSASLLLKEAIIRTVINLNELLLFSLEVGNGEIASALAMPLYKENNADLPPTVIPNTGATNIISALQYMEKTSAYGWKTSSYHDVFVNLLKSICTYPEAMAADKAKLKGVVCSLIVNNGYEYLKEICNLLSTDHIANSLQAQVNSLLNTIQDIPNHACFVQAVLPKTKTYLGETGNNALQAMFIRSLQTGNQDFFNFLLDGHADHLTLKAVNNKHNEAPLFVAVAYGRSEAVKKLLDKCTTADAELLLKAQEKATSIQKENSAYYKVSFLSNNSLSDEAFNCLQAKALVPDNRHLSSVADHN